MAAIFVVFFLVPLLLTVMVSFWDYNEYEILPDFTARNYLEAFEGCADRLFSASPELCTTLKTYVSTLRISLIVWMITLVLGFAIAYFLAFHVRSLTVQIVLFLICTIPFWTSNVIRMISWIPLLGRNGLINQALQQLGVIDGPLEWLLFSNFAVILAFVHLYTLFMIVPIFNSMMRIDRCLLEAARDAGASGWQTLANVVIPLSKPGIVIGSIFVHHHRDGRLCHHRRHGRPADRLGRQDDQARRWAPCSSRLPPRNAVILLATVLVVVSGLTRLVDIRKEL